MEQVIKIKSKLKIGLIIIILCILIAITIIYPKYSAIWDALFLISILYTSTQTILDTNRISNRKLPSIVIMTIIFAIIVALYEISIGESLIFSTAILIFANLLDEILNKKSS